MSLPIDSLSVIDLAVIRLRVALTVIKARVQMTGRRSWAMSQTDQDELNARLAAIHESVNRAVEELASLQQLVDSLADGKSASPP